MGGSLRARHAEVRRVGRGYPPFPGRRGQPAQWLGDYGVEIDWVDQPTDGHTHPSFQIEGYPKSCRSGFNLFNDINAIAESKNIDVRLSSPAKKLIQNPETKEILGVVADIKGKETCFKAKRGVIMAIGGYERNPRMFYDYNLPGIHLVAGGNPCNTGDGFPMVMEVGADLWHTNESTTAAWAIPASRARRTSPPPPQRARSAAR